MNITKLFAFVALLAFVSSSAVAQEASTSSEKSCQKCQCPSTQTTSTSVQEEGCTQCPVMTAAMEKLPKMTFKVGDEATCCSKSAAAMAKKTSKPIHFVVAEKTYEDKAEAYTAYVTTTEEFVNNFVTPHKCEVSGKTSLAGHSCDCPVTSAKYAEQIKTAVDAVAMSYKVGEESCGCPNKAAAMAKDEGAKVEFVVGEQCTTCEMTARVNLAHAKYKAAVAAITKATSKEESGS